MQTEEFYRKVHEKIERTEFSPDFLEWNQESVWARIEQKKEAEKPKTVFVWWRSSIAASIALATLVAGGYFLLKNNDTQSVAVSQTQRGYVAKSAELPLAETTNKNFQEVKKSEVQASKQTSEFPNNTLTENERALVDLENVQYPEIAETSVAASEIHKHPLPATTIIAADSPTETILETPKIHTELVDSQPFVAPPKFERTVILDIPDTEEYNRFQRTEKKTFFARLFKQVGKFNTEGTVDWEELNVKPNRIWAYVKESMKTEKREAK